jgi:multicomponent Na+:H+ antiporter subunit E
MTTAASIAASGSNAAAAALGRFVLFLGFWVALAGAAPADLAVGVPAAAGAVWLSLRLVPRVRRPLRFGALARFLLRLALQALVAGFDVARRAFAPRLPLAPGLVAYQTSLPPGLAREAFRAAMSLQPGTLPVSAGRDGPILFHCLDATQPVAAQLAAEEARFLRVLGEGPHRD